MVAYATSLVPTSVIISHLLIHHLINIAAAIVDSGPVHALDLAPGGGRGVRAHNELLPLQDSEGGAG